MYERIYKTWGQRETVICKHCKVSFEALVKQNRVYCSKACAIEGIKKRVTTECPICGTQSTHNPSLHKKYCSRKCAGIARRTGNDRIRKTRYIPRKTIDGKLRIIYRYKMEKHLGRKLKPNEIIHHIDMDDTSHDINNLYLCENISEHMKIHKSIEYLTKDLLKLGVIEFKEGKYQLCSHKHMERGGRDYELLVGMEELSPSYG